MSLLQHNQNKPFSCIWVRICIFLNLILSDIQSLGSSERIRWVCLFALSSWSVTAGAKLKCISVFTWIREKEIWMNLAAFSVEMSWFREQLQRNVSSDLTANISSVARGVYCLHFKTLCPMFFFNVSLPVCTHAYLCKEKWSISYPGVLMNQTVGLQQLGLYILTVYKIPLCLQMPKITFYVCQWLVNDHCFR